MDTSGLPLPEVRGREVLARGARFDFEEVSLLWPDGATHRRQHLRHPGAVCVLPLLATAQGVRAVLVRNYRAALGGYVLEVPAGTLETGETPDACVARELEEETGYRAATFRPLGRFHTSPGLSDEQMWAYVAWDLEPVGQHLDEDERLVVEELAMDAALGMALRGELDDAKTMLTLLWASQLGLAGAGAP